jgi:hypothetical protein
MNKAIKFGVIIVIFFLSGCGVISQKNLTGVSINQKVKVSNYKEKKLMKRFLQYWHARTKGDMKTAWKYEMPYQKFLDGFNKYKSEVSGYRGSTIELIKVEYPSKDVAIVVRRVRVGGKELLRKDKWIYVKDNWYHKYYQSVFPPETEEEAEFQ